VTADFQSEFNRLYQQAYRVAFRLTGRRSDADDIAQEALARAYVRWSRAAECPDAWVSQESIKLAIEWIRRDRLPWARILPPTLVNAPTPDRLALQRTLAAMPGPQRNAVGLRYVAELSTETVARAMKMPAATVDQHATRGLATLQQKSMVVQQ
jgi:RNA polymerase sigma factor (sigma-70 family)